MTRILKIRWNVEDGDCLGGFLKMHFLISLRTPESLSTKNVQTFVQTNSPILILFVVLQKRVGPNKFELILFPRFL